MSDTIEMIQIPPALAVTIDGLIDTVAKLKADNAKLLADNEKLVTKYNNLMEEDCNLFKIKREYIESLESDNEKLKGFANSCFDYEDIEELILYGLAFKNNDGDYEKTEVLK